MARLGREVEQKIPTREQVPHDMTTADVGNVDLHPITDIDDVGWIAAIFRDHTVDEHNFCTKLHRRLANAEPIKPIPPVITTRAPANTSRRGSKLELTTSRVQKLLKDVASPARSVSDR